MSNSDLNSVPEKFGRFHQRLIELRDRLRVQTSRGVEAVRGELNPSGNLSNTPIHLADAASGAVDSEIIVLNNEWQLLEQVNDALVRIHDGTYGTCLDCQASIPEPRLEQLPYTAYCVKCTDKHSASGRPQDHMRPRSPMRRLTGFDAIEFAEKEGLRLNKSGDSIDPAATGLTIAEAEAIATDNASLIWLDVSEDRYGERKNIRPER